jgi:hypothetical protein
MSDTLTVPDADGNLVGVGDVVQLSPDRVGDEFVNGFFPGCFMLVGRVFTWGIQGFISMPQERGSLPGQAHFRAKRENFVRIGKAEWVPAPDTYDANASDADSSEKKEPT